MLSSAVLLSAFLASFPIAIGTSTATILFSNFINILSSFLTPDSFLPSHPHTQFKYIETGIIAKANDTITENPIPTLLIMAR
jgi:hypothetical protein